MTSQHREALAGLIYSVCTKSGLTVLMGEAGTGKTTLLFSLLGMLEKKRLVTAMCTNSTLTREEFYDTLMLKFGIVCTSSLKSRQLLALQDMLQRNLADGRPSVLIVDEAQRLSMDLLEEIRLLLNLETPREKLLSIIISGQPELGDILARPELRQLRQRIGCNCKLKALSFSELQEYLHHRLKQAGVLSQTLFHEDTVELIYDFTQGIPRLVNSLCSGALQTGFGIQSRNITPAIIEEVARDLDLQRPTALPKSGVAPLAVGAENFPPTRLAAVPPVPKANPSADGPSDRHVPLDSYAARQESLGFFSGLLDRWK